MAVLGRSSTSRITARQKTGTSAAPKCLMEWTQANHLGVDIDRSGEKRSGRDNGQCIQVM